jgi:hypothetical protein
MAIPRRRTLQELLSSIASGAAPVYGGNANLQRGMSSPYMPSQTYPGAGGKPMMFPTYHDALDYWMANPSPGIDRPDPANWATSSSPSPTGTTGQTQADNAKTEAWWAAQPKPAGTPADWVYIGMGDWGPPQLQPTLAPHTEYGPASPLAIAPLGGGLLDYSGPVANNGGGVLGTV